MRHSQKRLAQRHFLAVAKLSKLAQQHHFKSATRSLRTLLRSKKERTMSSEYSIGAMNQLADALSAAGFTSGDVTKLKQYKDLALVKQLLYGYAKIIQVMHVIDCDADPFVPNGMKVVEHHKGGQLEWHAEKVALYLSKLQKNGEYIDGNKLRKELESMLVLNANVLDYLLAHSELIPEEWKSKAIFFWGTIYRHSDGTLYVRCLKWDGGQWHWYDYWLDYDFNSGYPAIVRAS